jgi:type IV secretion system protein VirD4
MGRQTTPHRSGIYCGLHRGRPIWYTGDSHVIGFGPTRSGKDAGVLIPLVKTYPGSIIVHDPAFQIAAVTARYRSRFSQVFFINPFGTLTNLPKELDGVIADLSSDGFNIMASGPMDPTDADFLTFYDNLARAATELTPHNMFWYNSAVGLRTAFFMFQRMVMRDHATMSGVRRMMIGYIYNPKTGKEEYVGVDKIIALMMETGYDPIISKIANFQKQDETRNNIFKHVETEMGCFDFHQTRRDELGKSYNFETAKHRQITVYFGVPSNLDGFQVWKRLIVGSILRDMMSSLPGEIDPLIVLNEAYQFGAMECIPNFLAGGAKHGARLMSIWQDPGQIDRQYKESATLVRGSRGAFWTLAPNEPKHAEYIRVILGKKSEWGRSYAAHTVDNSQSAAGLNDQVVTFNLMNDDDLIQMPKEKMIGMIEPIEHPIQIESKHYYKVPWLLDGLDPDPYHDPRFRVHDQARIGYDYDKMVSGPTLLDTYLENEARVALPAPDEVGE